MRADYLLSWTVTLCMASAWGPAAASPWGRAPGDVLAIERLELYRAEAADRRFSQTVAQSYVEFGAPRGITLSSKLATAWAEAENARSVDQRAGIAEASIGIQAPVLNHGAHRVAVRVTAHAPASVASLSGADIGASRDGAIDLALLWGHSSGHRFLSGSLAYRASVGKDADAVHLDLTLGRQVGEKGQVRLDLAASHAIAGTAEENGVAVSAISLSPALVLPLRGRYGLELGLRKDLWTDGTDAGDAAFIGLWRMP